MYKKHVISPIHVNISGHAGVTQLKKFASALNPVTIIPIHTLSPEKFPDCFSNKVRIFSDAKPTKLEFFIYSKK